jgi:hypothetical protein
VNDAALDTDFLRANEQSDHEQLVILYRKAGLSCIDAKNVDAGCFYLTHAYIFALEMGSSKVDELHEILVSYGREE